MTSSSDPRTQLGKLLDVALYAPLGVLLEGSDLLPRLAETGRKQVTFTRSLGQAALRGIVRSAQARSAPTTDAPPAPTTFSAPVALTVEGYDGLSAREVIARIATASTDEIAWMRSHESAHKARVTVLRALDAH